MRVSIEVGDGQELCYLLDREIDSKRTSREDIATYTAIRESLAEALDFERLQIAYGLDHGNDGAKEADPARRGAGVPQHGTRDQPKPM